MKSIPASVAFVGVATVLAVAVALPAAAQAADWTPPPAFPHPYTAVHRDEPVPVISVRDHSADPYRYTRERIPLGYGGPRIEHEFGIHPDDPERPRNRHYYPYVWGGYAFSAPYFVNRSDYSRPEYDQQPYGKAQKYRWRRDYKRPGQWEDGRW